MSDATTSNQDADPGIVHVGRWGVDDPALDSWGARLGYAAVARKPRCR